MTLEHWIPNLKSKNGWRAQNCNTLLSRYCWCLINIFGRTKKNFLDDFHKIIQLIRIRDGSKLYSQNLSLQSTSSPETSLSNPWLNSVETLDPRTYVLGPLGSANICFANALIRFDQKLLSTDKVLDTGLKTRDTDIKATLSPYVQGNLYFRP